LSHLIPLAFGVWLFVRAPVLHQRFLPQWPGWSWLGAVLVVAGLGWAAYARVHLGRNWSGIVTLKQDHTLITTGPYHWTRHPIYSGILLAILGTAVALGQLRGLVGFVLVAASFMRKSRIEERFMTAQFPAEYARYRAEVPALVPKLF
jgi:protein-S-isoprenylcysteine O-methyltransferase Ste14